MIASQQAKIDALMWEYCPEEMTPEQREEWAKHQKVFKLDDDQIKVIFSTKLTDSREEELSMMSQLAKEAYRQQGKTND